MEIRPCYSKGQIFINHQILNENPLPNENQACEGGTQRQWCKRFPRRVVLVEKSEIDYIKK